MELTPANKATIDSMTYEQLLARQQSAPKGNVWLEGETGQYWVQRMKSLRQGQGVYNGNVDGISWY